MDPVQIVKLIVLVSVMLTVLSLALHARPGDVFHLFRNWRLGLRAMVAMFVVVPAVALLMAGILDLKGPVKIALVALAFSPVPPLLPRKQVKAGGDAAYVTGLLVTAALCSLVLAPLGLALAGVLFGVETRVSFAGMARTLGLTIALPLVLGLLGQSLLGARAAMLSSLLGKLASLLFIGGVLGLLFLLAPAIGKLFGDGTVVALIAMSAVGLAAGWFLAGPVRDERIVLSLASAARHPGVAIGIAATSFPAAHLAPAAIVLAAVINAAVAIPFLRMLRQAE